MSKKIQLFKSQDSKYYLKTALKVASVPLFCFSITIYSLWIYLGMNHSYFVANGFASGDNFKEVLMDSLLSNVNHYGVYLFLFIVGVYFVGLGISHLVLRPFKEISSYFKELENVYSEDYITNGMNEKKLVVKSIHALVHYLRNFQDEPNAHYVPSEWEKINKPIVDKVFYLQYACIITILCIVTSMALYIFTGELHESIVENALKILNNNKTITIFFQSQRDVLSSIYTTSIVLNVSLYVYLSKKIIDQVDGVSFAFFRDIKQIISGNHKQRLFPRFQDPGKVAATSINNFLEDFFSQTEVPEEFDNVVSISVNKIISSDNPPPYIEEKAVANGVQFNVITPKGTKIENLGKDDLIRVLKEVEQ
jgi:hypothetical protein